jgi:hypothetical protein
LLESDFTATERIHLDRVAVRCGSDSASCSTPQPLVLSVLPSILTPKDIHVLTLMRIYPRTLVSFTVTSIPVHEDSHSRSLHMSPVQPSPTDFCYVIPISITFVNFNMFYILEVPDIIRLTIRPRLARTVRVF